MGVVVDRLRARGSRGTRPPPRRTAGYGSRRSRAPRGSMPSPARAASPSRAPRSPGPRGPAPGAPGPVWKRSYVSLIRSSKIREVLHHNVFRSGEIAGRADFERHDFESAPPSPRNAEASSNGGPGISSSRGRTLSAKNHSGAAVRALALRVDLDDPAALDPHGCLAFLGAFPDGQPGRRPRPKPMRCSLRKRAGREDGVRRDDEERRRSALCQRAPDRICRAERLRLTYEADGDPERRAVADELLHLLGEVPGDDRRPCRFPPRRDPGARSRSPADRRSEGSASASAPSADAGGDPRPRP